MKEGHRENNRPLLHLLGRHDEFHCAGKKEEKGGSVWAVQSKRLRVFGLEFDMGCSPVVSWRLPDPDLFGVVSAFHYCVERVRLKSTRLQKEIDLFS
jgi:hypothetical protein